MRLLQVTLVQRALMATSAPGVATTGVWDAATRNALNAWIQRHVRAGDFRLQSGSIYEVEAGNRSVSVQDDPARWLQAAVLYQDGQIAFNAGDFDAAIDAFRDAFGVTSNATSAIALARSYSHAGQTAEARAAYTRYLQLAPNGQYAAEARRAVGLVVTTSRSVTPPIVPPSIDPLPSSKLGLVLGLGAGVLAVGAAGWWLFSRRR